MTRLRTALILLLSAAAVAGLGLLANGGPATAASSRGPAAQAIRALTDGRADMPRSLLPPDFAAVMGYRPVSRAGRLLDLYGGCSPTAAPLPAEFELVCAEHDLGYDLLRYAARTDEPLGSWARVSLDRRMAQEMHRVCSRRSFVERRAGCHVAAETAADAVRLNSIRQLDGVPEETPASYAMSLAAALSSLSLVAFGRTAWS